MIEVTQFTSDDDLAPLVAAINSARWDEANDMSAYEVNALQASWRQVAPAIPCPVIVLKQTGESAISATDFNHGKKLIY